MQMKMKKRKFKIHLKLIEDGNVIESTTPDIKLHIISSGGEIHTCATWIEEITE